jgi:hypothetical protein
MAKLRRTDNTSGAGSKLRTTIVGSAILITHDIVDKKKAFNKKLNGFFLS